MRTANSWFTSHRSEAPDLSPPNAAPRVSSLAAAPPCWTTAAPARTASGGTGACGLPSAAPSGPGHRATSSTQASPGLRNLATADERATVTLVLPRATGRPAVKLATANSAAGPLSCARAPGAAGSPPAWLHRICSTLLVPLAQTKGPRYSTRQRPPADPARRPCPTSASAAWAALVSTAAKEAAARPTWAPAPARPTVAGEGTKTTPPPTPRWAAAATCMSPLVALPPPKVRVWV
mmetsp:Transcript_34457/g.77894  ORF Transcript_34457/g.77894 Transcript_34457/m.77894 type:complete len:236 (+) Transcript_34457:7803-8510(+)